MNCNEQSQQNSYSIIFSTWVLLSKLLYYNLQTLACFHFFILVREDLAIADDLPAMIRSLLYIYFPMFSNIFTITQNKDFRISNSLLNQSKNLPYD